MNEQESGILGSLMQILRKAANVFGAAIAPPLPIVYLAAPLILALMAWVFLLGNEGSPLSYVAYVASAYLLVVLCVAIARGPVVKWARSVVRRNRHVAKVIDDDAYRREISMATSLCINAFWAVVNFAYGIADASVWLITLGAYYLVFALMRLFVLRRFHGGRGVGCESSSYDIERICGWFLLLSTLVLSGIVTLTMKGEGTFRYEGLLIYAMATFSFYSLISSIVDVVRNRRQEDPLIATDARINLAVALVSLYALEIAMFAEFATESDAALVFVMPIITGSVVALILVFMGIRSIAYARRVQHFENRA